MEKGEKERERKKKHRGINMAENLAKKMRFTDPFIVKCIAPQPLTAIIVVGLLSISTKNQHEPVLTLFLSGLTNGNRYWFSEPMTLATPMSSFNQ